MWTTTFTQDTDVMNNGTLSAVYLEDGFTITHTRRVNLSDSDDVATFVTEAKTKLTNAKTARDGIAALVAPITTALNAQ